ncbi:hypothetical protein BO78DRAFT_400403 [Aspergillus sclerotiicarbonarius CBS 121057]|uniref:Uncharacterized protein n=1 Tax=Aspergillus sclerotiicarbonarius (strain CBS 121057 / IBT 28362) TaxID=1448318 RepID=A0A319E338_ASPSB|nr:hypothetical protein BO78DRAFT_400403 [Aspergillus sclerotiicarbonarius CBS 121057]
MSTHFLFCTADMPASMLNDFMDQFRCFHSPDCPTFFCVVRTPDQTDFDEWGTELPISDFSTGFKNATDAELRRFARQKISELRDVGKRGPLDSDWIAIMDERSRRDGTVVMQFNKELSMWTQDLEDAEEPFEIPGDTDVSGDDIWWKWRVPFAGAVQVFNSVDNGDPVMIRLYSRPEYVGPDGVLNVDIPRKIIRGDIKDPINQEKS